MSKQANSPMVNAIALVTTVMYGKLTEYSGTEIDKVAKTALELLANEVRAKQQYFIGVPTGYDMKKASQIEEMTVLIENRDYDGLLKHMDAKLEQVASTMPDALLNYFNRVLLLNAMCSRYNVVQWKAIDMYLSTAFLYVAAQPIDYVFQTTYALLNRTVWNREAPSKRHAEEYEDIKLIVRELEKIRD